MLKTVEDDSITWEPLQALIKDDPFTLAEYDQANNLLMFLAGSTFAGSSRIRRYLVPCQAIQA